MEESLKKPFISREQEDRDGTDRSSKDVMAELGSADYPDTVNIRGYKPNTNVHMGQLKRALKMLKKAKEAVIPCRRRCEYRPCE